MTIVVHLANGNKMWIDSQAALVLAVLECRFKDLCKCYTSVLVILVFGKCLLDPVQALLQERPCDRLMTG